MLLMLVAELLLWLLLLDAELLLDDPLLLDCEDSPLDAELTDEADEDDTLLLLTELLLDRSSM